MALRTGAPLLLAVASAFTLLAEAMVAVALARSWHASWWEWHVLMLMAFGAIAYSARREDGAERFSDLYLDETAAGKREVSVMFADLEGFTTFSEGRDPREVSEMLNTYLSVAIPPIVSQHGGEIDRLIGDAIMATWGTRGDQPDHARRAVDAALAVQRETCRIADAHPGWPRFRAAVNTGEALVGVLGAESGRSYTVIGDTVNLAARLESQAPAGRVVIGSSTLRAVPGARVEALESMRVKGRSEPVDAYLVDERRQLFGAGLTAIVTRETAQRRSLVVREAHVPDPGGASAVDRRALGVHQALRGRAEEARAVRLADREVALARHRHVGGDRHHRLGQRRVGAAVHQAERLLDALFDREAGAAALRARLEQLEAEHVVERARNGIAVNRRIHRPRRTLQFARAWPRSTSFRLSSGRSSSSCSARERPTASSPRC